MDSPFSKNNTEEFGSEDWLPFYKSFHYYRKKMFESNNLMEMKIQIISLLELSSKANRTNRFKPMSNFEAAILELESMLYGINNWEVIKAFIVNNPGILQTSLIKVLDLNKDKTALFLYRVSLFGLLNKSKIKNRNSYEYIGEKLDKMTTIKYWPNMWEIPYKEYQNEFQMLKLTLPALVEGALVAEHNIKKFNRS